MEDKKGKSAGEVILLFQLNKQITNLFVSFLEQIEDLEADGYIFPAEKRANIRKRILSRGNDAIRNLEELIQKLDIQFK